MKLAFITDIHEDVESLKLVLKDIEKQNCDKIICLGDILGFSSMYYLHSNSRNTSECLKLIRQNCEIVILGNHDLHALGRIPKKHKGFNFPESWYDLSFYEREKISDNSVFLYDDGEEPLDLNINEVNYLNSLDEFGFIKESQFKIFLSHYIYPNINGTLRKFYSINKEYKDHKDLLFKNDCDFSISGHRHFLGLFIASKRILQKDYNSIYKIKKGDCILVPPLVSNGCNSSYAILYADSLTIEAKIVNN